MTAQNALRFLGHEAERCHRLSQANDTEARDAHTMLCLLLPALLKVLDLEAMDRYEAMAFERDLHTALRERIEQEQQVPA